MKVSCEHSEPGVGAKCNTNVRCVILARYLSQPHDVFPAGGLFGKHPRNRYRKHNCDTRLAPCSINADRYFHCDPRSQMRWFVGFYGTWPSKASAYWSFWAQNSRLHHIPGHPLVQLATKCLWVSAGFSHALRSTAKCFGGEYQKPVTDLVDLCALDRRWGWLAFAFFCLSFWLKHAMCTTVFAVILLLLEAVRAIFDNVCASAHSTTISNCFLDHATYLTITYFSSTTKYLAHPFRHSCNPRWRREMESGTIFLPICLKFRFLLNSFQKRLIFTW